MASSTIASLQSPGDTPNIDGLDTVTNGVLPQMSIADRLAHFSESAYDITPESHLFRLMSALLGDGGVGQLRKRLSQVRLQSTLQGSHFYDLDRFYGALFNVKRFSNESLPFDLTKPLTQDQLAQVQVKDASYRSRIFQFARAIGYGATPLGMQLAAEAILSVPCEIFESYLYADSTTRTYGQVTSTYSTYGGLEGTSYASIEGATVPTQQAGPNRIQFIVQPHRPITEEERYDVLRVLAKLKPANSLVAVSPDGVDLHSPVRLRGVGASSEHWEITKSVQRRQVGSIALYSNISGDITTPPRPPFGGHQGEFWTYNNDITGTLAYALDYLGHTQNDYNQQRIYFSDGSFHDYSTQKAITSPWLNALSKIASDGGLTINPLDGRGTTVASQLRPDGTFNNIFTAPTLCPIYIDGQRIEDVVVTLNAPGGVGSTLLSQEEERESFWSTQPRMMEDRTEEVYEVRYSTVESVNEISFDHPNFPHSVNVEYLSEDTNSWVHIQSFSINTSVPAIFPTDQSYFQDGHTHPHHYTDDHWVNQIISLGDTPIKTRAIRFREVRINGTAPTTAPRTDYWFDSYSTWVLNPAYVDIFGPNPVYGGTEPSAGHINKMEDVFISQTYYNSGSYDTPGYPVAYELGLRRVDIGYRITAKDMLPTITHIDTVVGRSTDVFGSTVTFGVHEDKAMGLLQDPPLTWKSEPQIAPNAVVNFYADTRDVTGTAQLIDRFYVEPTHIGVHTTIYYSNDTPTGNYAAVDDALPNGVIVFNGNIATNPADLTFSSSDTSYITIDNTAIQLVPSKNWWAAISFKALVGSSKATSVFDVGGGRVTIATDTVTLTAASGNAVSVAQQIAPNQEVRIIAGYLATDTTDYPSGLVLIVQVGQAAAVTGTGVVTSSMGTQPPLLALGAVLTGPLGIAAYSLHSFILKQDTLTRGAVAAFQANPSAYVTKGPQRGNDDGTSDNAVLRFDPTFISSDHPSGLVGGPPSAYPDMIWTPILRDFTLQKGYLSIPPTKAKFFKFEMTNLVPEIYETLVPVTRKTLFFPTEVIPGQGSDTSTGSTPETVNTLKAILAGQSIAYADTTVPITTAQDIRNALETEVLVANDPHINATLSSTNYVYGFQDWHQGSSAPSFEKVSSHGYQEVELPHTDKMAYWCGLNVFKAFRLSFLANDDTNIYSEQFNDGNNIATNTWNQNPQDLTTANLATPVTATSKILASTHNVTGVQFATQQSASLQLVPDDDFVDPANIGYKWDDTSRWHALGDAVLSYNPNTTTVDIFRHPPATSGSSYTVANKVVHLPVAPVFHYPATSQFYVGTLGGIASPLVGLSSQGRVYVAARLRLVTDITNPLLLQIINGNDGITILSSKPIVGKAGDLVEVYDFYDIGSISPATTPVFVQIVQNGTSTDAYSLDTLSLFDPGILWQFSNNGGTTFYDATSIRNNANGILTFPERGNELVWRAIGLRQNMHVSSIRIRPMYEGQISARESGPLHGPNASVYDTYPQIEDDPEFNDWVLPVPRYWFLAYKNYPALFPNGAPIITPYARFYARTANDTPGAPTDVVTRLLTPTRTATERLDISNPVSDGSVRKVSGFRTAVDTVPSPGETTYGGKVIANTVVNRQVHTLKGAPFR